MTACCQDSKTSPLLDFTVPLLNRLIIPVGLAVSYIASCIDKYEFIHSLTHSLTGDLTMHSAVAAVEVATVDVLDVVDISSMPQPHLVLSSWVSHVHLRLLGHVQPVQMRVLDSLHLL